MSSPQRVSVIVPVSSFKVASATRVGPRDVVTSRGSDMAVMVPSMVALAFALSVEIPGMTEKAKPPAVKQLTHPPEPVRRHLGGFSENADASPFHNSTARRMT